MKKTDDNGAFDHLLEEFRNEADLSDLNAGRLPGLGAGGDRATGLGLPAAEMLRNVRLKVQVQLGSTRMPLGKALDLDAGSVVELGQEIDEPVTLFVNQEAIARGQLLVVEDRFCVRVTEILSGAEAEAGAEFLGELAPELGFEQDALALEESGVDPQEAERPGDQDPAVPEPGSQAGSFAAGESPASSSDPESVIRKSDNAAPEPDDGERAALTASEEEASEDEN